jgi:hypothetical protein
MLGAIPGAEHREGHAALIGGVVERGLEPLYKLRAA